MAMFTNTVGTSGVLPPDYGQLIVQPLSRDSVAFQVSTVVQTGSHTFHVPSVVEDAGAGWIPEGGDIPIDDAVLAETVVTPSKVGGLVVISRELAMDSTPQAAQLVGDGLARSIVNQIDGAYFGAMAAPAPSGLGALVGFTDVPAGTAWTNADAFTTALFAVESLGANIGAFVAHPDTAKVLATLKDATGSNRPLLTADVTQPTRRVIGGVPLLTSPAVAAGVVWGIPQTRSIVVMRENVQIETDASLYFASDKIAVRAILRCGFAFPQPAAIAKIHLTA